MATYNGAAYVEAQLRSILDELDDADEVVVVDDASRDDTVSVVEAIADPRIRIIRQEQNRGYVKTFEHAILAARGDVIFLSDQDDEWVQGRRAALLNGLAHSDVAAGNLVLLGSEQPLRSPLTGRPWLLSARTSPAARLRRILMGDIPYFGCAMAIRRTFVPTIAPFPGFLIESHDLWIATVANVARTMTHVEAPVVRRRLHDTNASSPRPRDIRRVLAARWMLIRAWREARRRVRARRRR